MPETASLPAYEFLPAPLWLLTILHVLTLALHFVAMNLLVGGLVVVLAGRFPNRWSHPAVSRFVGLMPSLMAATITLGVAPLLFSQLTYGRTIYAAAIVSAWAWLAIPFIAIIAYSLLYAAAFAVKTAERGRFSLPLALLALVSISLIYSSVFSLAERPDLARGLYAGDASGRAIHGDLSYWGLRWLHMLLGAVSVGGFGIALFARGDQDAVAAGRRFFVGGLVGTLLAGIAYAATLAEIHALLRSATLWWLVGSILLSLLALLLFLRGHRTLAAAPLFLSLIGMVVIRHQLRLVRLEGHFVPTAYPEAPQWGAFAAFAVCFAVGLGLVVAMVRLFRRPLATP